MRKNVQENNMNKRQNSMIDIVRYNLSTHDERHNI